MSTKFRSNNGIRSFVSIAVALCGIVGTARSQSFIVGNAIPLSEEENLLVAGGGDVTVTITADSSSAADTDVLSLYAVNPNSGIVTLVNPLTTPLVNNQTTPIGTQVDLGSFVAGSELIFQVVNENTATTFYSGSDSSLNPDGVVHFDVQGTSGGSTTVGVEDLDKAQSSDYDYNDVVYTFTGVSAADPVPETSSTLPLFGMGLGVLGLFAPRFKK
jgi:uncharacterized protein DUF4114